MASVSTTVLIGGACAVIPFADGVLAGFELSSIPFADKALEAATEFGDNAVAKVADVAAAKLQVLCDVAHGAINEVFDCVQEVLPESGAHATVVRAKVDAMQRNGLEAIAKPPDEMS